MNEVNIKAKKESDAIVQNFSKIRKEETKFSQEQVAEKMGKTQSAYARIERGATKIDLETLCAFADIVGMSIHEVIAYPDKIVVEETKPELILQLIKKGDELKITFRDKELELLKLV